MSAVDPAPAPGSTLGGALMPGAKLTFGAGPASGADGAAGFKPAFGLARASSPPKLAAARDRKAPSMAVEAERRPR